MVTVGPAAACVHGVGVYVPLAFAQLGGVPRVRTGRRLIVPVGVRRPECRYRSYVAARSQAKSIEQRAKSAICAGRNRQLLVPDNPVSMRATFGFDLSVSSTGLRSEALTTPPPHHSASVTFCCSVFTRTDKQEEIGSGRKGRRSLNHRSLRIPVLEWQDWNSSAC